MTERERWIVYPLLFLALGAALRDKLSEHTKTGTLECQELVVYGEDVAGQPGKPLVQIGAIKRTSAQSPHVGQIVVDGLIHAQGIEAETMQAANVNADNYFFRRIQFAPLMRGVPGKSAADQLRALQLRQQAAEAAKNSAQDKPPTNENSNDVDEKSQPEQPGDSPDAPSTPAD